MFHMMNNWGLKIPDYGTCKALSNRHNNMYEKVVVYLDQYSHRGEDKELLWLEKAKDKYPDKLASLYQPTAFKQYDSISYRLLQIGDKRYWFFYGSKDDWRSNNGDVDIEFMSCDENYGYTKIPYPLYAIDFVDKHINKELSEKEELYAIDFNTAPGLKGTFVEERVEGEEIVDSIKKFYNEYNKEKYLDKKVYKDIEEETSTKFKYYILNLI